VGAQANPRGRSKIPRVFAVTPSIGLWRCFACHEKGDCIELVSRVLKITKYEAAKELQRLFPP
jgi:DNA primase